MNCGNINGKKAQAFGLVPATKKPSLNKDNLDFSEFSLKKIVELNEGLIKKLIWKTLKYT